MTTPAVWISTTIADLTFDDGTPGHHWEFVGTINTTEETDLNKHIQVLLNMPGTAPPITGFYLSGDPDSTWVQAAKQDPANQQPFWIAIDPWGKMRPQIHGARETYFVSNDQVTVTKSLTRRRTPEPHPGETIKPVMIGIKVKHNTAGPFTPQHKPAN